jgi:hypothetical protein
MLKQQKTTDSKKNFQIPSWQRISLVTATLLSGGSLTALAPSQVAYASSSHSHTHYHVRHIRYRISTNVINTLIVCETGNGGQGGSATENSGGASGGPGGDCIITLPISVSLTLQITP